MKYTQMIVFFFNIIGAMGFSLIAPLFPPLCKLKGISNEICSYIISSICISQIFGSIYSPIFIEKVGIKQLYLISLIGQSICTFCYSFIVYIDNNFIFIITGFIIRLLHGIFSIFVSVISFSITSLINEGKELERAMGYMELSWGIGLALGPVIISIFFGIGGYSLPFIIIGFVDLSTIFFFYKIPNKDFRKESTDFSKEEKEKKANIEKFSFIKVISYIECFLLTGSIIIELNTTDFYIPTLVNYLYDKFSISTSRASLFFLASTIGYIISTQMINKFTDLCNNFKLIFIGHVLAIFCCLLTAPIGILPQKYIFIIIGIFFQGFIGGIINIPAFVELNNFGKKIFSNNEQLQRDIPSSLINFSFCFGDLIEPIIGAWITNHFSFQSSAYFAAFCSFSMAITFRYYFYNQINEINCSHNESLLIKKKESSINKEEN